MANRNGEPPPVTIKLTDIQRDRIAMARASLADSAADETGDHSPEHQAALEYRLESMLEIIDELTGGAERDVALCRKCGAAIHRPLATAGTGSRSTGSRSLRTRATTSPSRPAARRDAPHTSSSA